jgi:endonuclease III
MMYSLEMDVFPVDVNVQRIAERMGIIPRSLKHYEAQQRLPKFVPDGCSKKLHIGLVIHGRIVCQPIKPDCGVCILNDLCRTGKKATLN